MTIYSGAECSPDGRAGKPGFWAINMIYGTDYAKVIRSYSLSRNLTNSEQLDFSAAYQDSGATMDKTVIDNTAKSCNYYDYSAYASNTGEGGNQPGAGNGRSEGCYTIESPHMFEQCVSIKVVDCPQGLPACGGEISSDAKNGQPALAKGNGASSLSTDTTVQAVSKSHYSYG